MLKYVFIVGLTRFFCLDFGDNYVKTNEDTPMMSATTMFAGSLVSGNIRLMRIFATRVLARGGVINNGVVGKRLIFNAISRHICGTFKH